MQTARRTAAQHSATETILRNARVIAMDQKLDFSPGDKPDVGKTATLELTPKQTELVTLAVKMGDLSLVLRSLQDVNDDGRDAAVENAPAEPGDSFTEDSQVSRLIRPASAARRRLPAPLSVVLRGSARNKLDVDGTGEASPSDGSTKPAENKTNKTVFTPMTKRAAMTPSLTHASTLSIWRRAGAVAGARRLACLCTPAQPPARSGHGRRQPAAAQGAAQAAEGQVVGQEGVTHLADGQCLRRSEPA